MQIYDLKHGNSPLIISIPHAGTFVPEDIKSRFTDIAHHVPDTDWFVQKLYVEYAKQHDATVITANYSRYVVDLNRPADGTPLYPGQACLPICPPQSFDGDNIYQDGAAPTQEDINQRISAYWQPYHDEISTQIKRIKEQHGYAILYDAHSIRQTVPRLFDGALPVLNLGTVNGKSCHPFIENAAHMAAEDSNYDCILNGRFIGGYITRHYGNPDAQVHALQMELAQSAYMDEDTVTYDEEKAEKLKTVLSSILNAMTDNARTRVITEAIG